ncbi:MAG TPA: DUF4383 domain-containing protein [Solirubrobacterales bacterium]|jgi:hypothetical protein|nr:DUF4383 domain-containing protein [Solirubrobacterales bacterium]
MNDTYTPASLYAGLIGGVLVVAGILGFFYSSSFGDPGEVDAVLGVLDVNAWHNLVHIASGALGVLAFRSGPAASRTYALVFGAIYIVVAIWGFAIGDGESILGFIPVNSEDNVLHAILGVLGIGAYAASDPRREPEGAATGRAA